MIGLAQLGRRTRPPSVAARSCGPARGAGQVRERCEVDKIVDEVVASHAERFKGTDAASGVMEPSTVEPRRLWPSQEIAKRTSSIWLRARARVLPARRREVLTFLALARNNHADRHESERVVDGRASPLPIAHGGGPGGLRPEGRGRIVLRRSSAADGLPVYCSYGDACNHLRTAVAPVARAATARRARPAKRGGDGEGSRAPSEGLYVVGEQEEGGKLPFLRLDPAAFEKWGVPLPPWLEVRRCGKLKPPTDAIPVPASSFAVTDLVIPEQTMRDATEAVEPVAGAPESLWTPRWTRAAPAEPRRRRAQSSPSPTSPASRSSPRTSTDTARAAAGREGNPPRRRAHHVAREASAELAREDGAACSRRTPRRARRGNRRLFFVAPRDLIVDDVEAVSADARRAASPTMRVATF